MSLTFHQGELDHPDVHALLAEHLAGMHANSPPESVHALPLDSLRSADLSFWTVRGDGRLLGMGALRELDAGHGEIKSMRTTAQALRQGAGTAMLRHLLALARARGYRRVSLETGRTDAFAPARRIYERHGFTSCPPFADYSDDPFSCFMTLALD